MRPLRYSINVTLDGCVDHRVGVASEELHRYHAANLERADALIFGRVTYQMMEEAWRLPATGEWPEWMPEWMVVSGDGLFVGGVTLPSALAELGLIDEYEFVVNPVVAGHGPTLLAGLSEPLELELVGREEIGSGTVASRYRPGRAATW